MILPDVAVTTSMILPWYFPFFVLFMFRIPSSTFSWHWSQIITLNMVFGQDFNHSKSSLFLNIETQKGPQLFVSFVDVCLRLWVFVSLLSQYVIFHTWHFFVFKKSPADWLSLGWWTSTSTSAQAWSPALLAPLPRSKSWKSHGFVRGWSSSFFGKLIGWPSDKGSSQKILQFGASFSKCLVFFVVFFGGEMSAKLHRRETSNAGTLPLCKLWTLDPTFFL